MTKFPQEIRVTSYSSHGLITALRFSLNEVDRDTLYPALMHTWN